MTLKNHFYMSKVFFFSFMTPHNNNISMAINIGFRRHFEFEFLEIQISLKVPKCSEPSHCLNSKFNTTKSARKPVNSKFFCDKNAVLIFFYKRKHFLPFLKAIAFIASIVLQPTGTGGKVFSG